MSEDPSIFGNDLFGNAIRQVRNGPLSQRYEFPPFSVLNAREGDWQDRKRAWLNIGIRGEKGREGKLFRFSKSLLEMSGGYFNDDGTQRPTGDTSVFDPVLTELCYKWFCPAGGQIVDPFAGGSVRGLVAGLLGFKYHGIDLRAEQIEANRVQLTDVAPGTPVEWVCGDSLDKVPEGPDADFVFSCPPYGDLERYSDDPLDLSTMEYHTFLPTYKRIIMRCAKKLKPNRFACFVVGDFRDKRTGMYRGFVADTINAFRECGMELYNDAVLTTSVGSVAMRSGKQFDASRKLGKCHQNVLVFCKGKPWPTIETEAA